MLTYLFDSFGTSGLYLIAAGLLGFIISTALFVLLKSKLPTDIGRAFAVNAQAAKGKPRGAGIIFISVFTVLSIIFLEFNIQNLAFLALIFFACISGFLDDASRAPWGEYKKGLIDLVISLLCAVVFVIYNGTTIHIFFLDTTVTLPVWLYIILGTILVWVSINVTNCTDGVDGLSSSLTLITLGSFLYTIIFSGLLVNDNYISIVIFMGCIAAYLMFNCSPSIILMGDAGSRAIGVFFAIVAMRTHAPLIYIPLCLVFILDGGLGLIKVIIMRFLKIKFLTNIRFPLHDHMRKNKGWSDTQTVIRFNIVQLLVSFIYLFAFVR